MSAAGCDSRVGTRRVHYIRYQGTEAYKDEVGCL